MSIPELRANQKLAVERIRDGWKRKVRNLLLAAPARSGKTTIFSYIAKCAYDHSLATIEKYKAAGQSYEEPYHVLIVASRRELIQQASSRIAKYGIKHGIVMAGDSRSRPNMIVQVASMQTLRRRPEWMGKFKLIIIDECHASSSASYMWLIENNPKAYLLGFTATPFRTDNKPLGKIYGELIKISTVIEQISLGYLVPYRVFCPFIPDTTGLKANKDGDFDSAQAGAIMDKPELVGNIVQEWMKRCSSRQTICYASNVQHSKNIVAQFQAAGIRAAHIDATTPKAIRKRIRDDIENGNLQLVSNVGIWTEGVDIPCVSAIIFARLTESRVLYIQAGMRGMGAYDESYEFIHKYGLKSDMILLDHAGVTHKFGSLYDQEVDELSRDNPIKGIKDQTLDDLKMRQCPKCDCCHPTASLCPECGYIYAPAERELKQVEGELQELDLEKFRKDKANQVKKAKTIEALKVIEGERGYKSGWAERQLEFRKKAKDKAIAAYQYNRWGVGSEERS